MSLDPGFRRVYSNDTYQDVYKTTVVNTALESDGERGSSGIKARGWSLLTMVWSAVASPINMIRHIGSALLFGSFNLLRGDVEQAKKEFLNHSFKALDSAARLVGGTVLGAVGIAMPETAAKANFAFMKTLGTTFGREASLDEDVDQEEALKTQESQRENVKKPNITDNLTQWIQGQLKEPKFASSLFDSICDKSGEISQKKLEWVLYQHFLNDRDLFAPYADRLAKAYSQDDVIRSLLQTQLTDAKAVKKGQ